MKDNFKILDNYIPEENVNSHFEHQILPKKFDSHLSNFLVYELEIHNTDGDRPYCISIYRLSKLAGRYTRDLSQYELANCEKETLVFDGDNGVINALNSLLKYKREEREV